MSVLPQEVAVSDPRYGTFRSLVLSDGDVLEGPWVFHHNGFGDHNFIHVTTANLVPPTAVKEALR